MKKVILLLAVLLFNFSVGNGQWIVINNSVNNPVEGFADNGTILYAAVAGNGVYKTTDLGNNWILSNSGITTQPFNNIAAKDSFVFVSSNLGLLRSTNYGTTWDSLPSINSSVFSVIIVNNLLYVGMINGIKRSTDWGNSWVWINNGIASNSLYIKSLSNYGNTIYAGSGLYNLRIYKSTNNGDNWIYISPEIPLNNIAYSLYSYDSLLLCGTATGVYKSINGGTNWDLIQGIPGNIGLFGFASVGTRYIFISAWNHGVYVSNNYGQSFISKNEGLLDYRCTALYNYGDNLFLGTNPYTYPCKIYRRPLSEVVSIKNISSEIPDSYKLYQNYPNPFNPTTNIKYQIRAEDRSQKLEVRIIVYDIMGREVATLINEKQSPGIYEVSFDGSNSPSGIYFYSLFIDGNKIDTKKLVLLK